MNRTKTVLSPVLGAALLALSSAGRTMRSLSGATAALTLTEEELHAVVTVD